LGEKFVGGRECEEKGRRREEMGRCERGREREKTGIEIGGKVRERALEGEPRRKSGGEQR
jgi:hypothetical protein